MLAPIRAEHVVVGAMLIIVLEDVIRLRRPFDQLALLELVQLMPDLGCVLGMRGQQEQDVMEQNIGRKDSTKDH